MSETVVDTEEYVGLLIRAGEFDSTKWPAGMEQGAVLLARIRGIEQLCREEHGVWDWELLPPDLQDEYDCVCLDLSRLRDEFFPPGPNIPAEEFFAQLEAERAETAKWVTR